MERMDIWARMVDEYRPTAIIIGQGYPSQYTNSSRDRQPASQLMHYYATYILKKKKKRTMSFAHGASTTAPVTDAVMRQENYAPCATGIYILNCFYSCTYYIMCVEHLYHVNMVLRRASQHGDVLDI